MRGCAGEGLCWMGAVLGECSVMQPFTPASSGEEGMLPCPALHPVPSLPDSAPPPSRDTPWGQRLCQLWGTPQVHGATGDGAVTR